MSTRDGFEPASFEAYRRRRAQREPFPPEVVRRILTGQPTALLTPDTVGLAYTGDDADIIRKQAEELHITPEDFINEAVQSAIQAQRFHEQGGESIARFVPPHMRLVQATVDSAVLFAGGIIRNISPITPKE